MILLLLIILWMFGAFYFLIICNKNKFLLNQILSSNVFILIEISKIFAYLNLSVIKLIFALSGYESWKLLTGLDLKKL